MATENSRDYERVSIPDAGELASIAETLGFSPEHLEIANVNHQYDGKVEDLRKLRAYWEKSKPVNTPTPTPRKSLRERLLEKNPAQLPPNIVNYTKP
ncbi:hypothetical protein HYW76_01760 [Candidatus Pacearchaeota archaeon]|nr:hypothetical protein [Candidatus Pacearchaeota archaeon]